MDPATGKPTASTSAGAAGSAHASERGVGHAHAHERAAVAAGKKVKVKTEPGTETKGADWHKLYMESLYTRNIVITAPFTDGLRYPWDFSTYAGKFYASVHYMWIIFLVIFFLTGVYYLFSREQLPIVMKKGRR